jgi:hypothetical protein
MKNIVILYLIVIAIIILPLSYSYSPVLAQQGFLLYENPDYNIKLQYPSNWTKNEVNLAARSPVYFSTPTKYSYETPKATMNIFVARLSGNYSNYTPITVK